MADISSEVYWQDQVGQALSGPNGRLDCIQGGNYAILRQIPLGDGYVQTLAVAEGERHADGADFRLQPYLRYGYADHWYSQGGGYQNITDLILHSTIHQNAVPFSKEAAAAHDTRKHFVMGETNSGDAASVPCAHCQHSAGATLFLPHLGHSMARGLCDANALSQNGAHVLSSGVT